MWAAAWGIRARQKEPYHRNDLDEALRWLDRLLSIDQQATAASPIQVQRLITAKVQ